MASKSKVETQPRPNRVRFVMLEADLTDGNFSDLTAAITQALRPVPVAPRMLPSGPQPAPQLLTGRSDPSDGQDSSEELIDEVETEVPTQEAVPRSPRTPKKFPMPEYRHELDITGTGESFKDYAARLAPKSILQKYLVSTKWLKDFGQSPTIDIHKVYTCFRTAGWSTKINDWDSAFRSLKQINKIRRTDDGTYAITPIGEDDVK